MTEYEAKIKEARERLAEIEKDRANLLAKYLETGDSLYISMVDSDNQVSSSLAMAIVNAERKIKSNK